MGVFHPTHRPIVSVVLHSMCSILYLAQEQASPLFDIKKSIIIVTNWMLKVCNDDCTEPTLQPITGEIPTGASAIKE